MKTIKRLITLTAVLAMLLSAASCSLLNKANFTQEITAENIKVTIRDDMKEQDEIKNDDDYITGYLWNGYGMNIGNVSANDTSTVKLSGQTGDDILKKVGESGKNPSEIKKYGDISYIQYTESSDGTDFFSDVYIMELGYEYYFFEFYTKPDNAGKYQNEYEKIIDSVSIIEEPAKTADVNIEGVALTMDGDAFEQSSGTWFCSRYSVTVYNSGLSSSLSSPENFVNILLKSGYKTADGQDVTEYKTTDGGVPYFEAMADELYGTHYVKEIDGKVYYIMLSTMVPADDQLKAEFNNIVDGAHAA